MFGEPLALQQNVTFSPDSLYLDCGCSTIRGNTEIKKQMFENIKLVEQNLKSAGVIFSIYIVYLHIVDSSNHGLGEHNTTEANIDGNCKYILMMVSNVPCNSNYKVIFIHILTSKRNASFKIDAPYFLNCRLILFNRIVT